MAKLDLEFIGLNNLVGNILINGKFPKFKKTENKTLSCQIETTANECEVIIYKAHHYTGKAWLFWNLFYFIISIFGIFDERQNKKCLVIDAKFTITTTQDTQVVISKQDFVDGGKLVSIDTASQTNEISNIQYYDKEARKKHSKMKKFKILTTILIVILLVVLIIVL